MKENETEREKEREKNEKQIEWQTAQMKDREIERRRELKTERIKDGDN